MKKFFETDDVQLVKAEITTSSGTTEDLRGVLTMVDVYEDIYEPTLYCEVILIDSLNLAADLPIIGEETLKLVFVTPGADDSATYEFFVYGVNSMGYGDNNKFVTYKLNCVSKEHLTNSLVSVEKSYKSSVSDIVRDILDSQLSTSKQIKLGTTKGINEVVIPSLSPFEAIGFLQGRAIDTSGYSPFLFFENKRGFHFYSIEKLFNENKSQSTKNTFTHGTYVTLEDKTNNKAFRNIFSIEYLKRFDTMEKIALGAFGNEVLAYDTIQKKTKTVEFKIDSEASNIFKNATPSNTSRFMSQNNKLSTTYYFADNPTQGKTFLPDLAGKRAAYLVHFNQNIVRVLINGDTGLAAGDVVNLKIPSGAGLTDESKTFDNKTKGDFMISRLRHMIQKTDGKFKHRISMDCNRLGYGS